MALFSPTTEHHRIPLPTDLPFVSAGDWIEISTGYTAALRKKIGRRALQPDPLNPTEATFDYNSWKQALLEEIITAWSEKEPVSPDSIGQLHPRVQDYICEQFDSLSAGRTDAEVNASSSDSPVGPELAAANSPTNSAGSQS